MDSFNASVYTRDAKGRITEVDTVADGLIAFTYDAADRLVSASGYSSADDSQADWTTTTVFDAVGRRLSEQSETFDAAGNSIATDFDRFNYEGWNTTSHSPQSELEPGSSVKIPFVYSASKGTG